MLPPQDLVCGLCGEVSRRASRISCCQSQCCWNCGVRSGHTAVESGEDIVECFRFITKERKCWHCPNTAVVTKDLVKDVRLREEISSWNKQKSSEQISEQQDQGKLSHSESIKSAPSENLPLPEPVPVCPNRSEKEEEKEDGSLTACGGPGDLQLTGGETEEPSTADPQTSDEGREEVLESSVSTTEEPEPSEVNTVEKEEEAVSNEDHLNSEAVSESYRSDEVPTDLNSPSSPSKQAVEVNLQDSEETQHETEENPSLISSETIALLFDPVEDTSAIAIDKTPIKIDLKNSFKKLSDRIQVDTAGTLEEELEMFENTRAADLPEKENTEEMAIENVSDENREIRIIKMVDDVETFEKIDKIKEELDKTKQITSRRKSEDTKLTVKPFEVKPIKNALQGLQALLKISGGGAGGGGGPTSGELKTDAAKRKEGGGGFESRASNEEKSDGSQSRSSSRNDAKTSRSRSRSRSSRSRSDHEKKTESIHGSSRVPDRRRSKSRSPSQHIRSRSRNRERKSYDESRKENSRSSRSSTTKPGRSRSRSKSSTRQRSTKINRSAVVRDSRVEDEYKTLVENNRKHSVEPKSLRPRAASEKSRAEEDEIKVVSYKDVKPKCEDRGYVRIIRSVGSDGEEVSDKLGKRWTSDTADKPAKVVKKVVEKERIVRKVYAVEKNVDGVSNLEKVTLEKSVKQIKEIHSQDERASVTPDRQTSLEVIKKELERVKNRVDNIRNKSGAENESDSESEMKSIMKDVKQMEAEVRDISEDSEVRTKPKKRKKGKEREEIKAEVKKVKQVKPLESNKKKNENEGKKDIEINSKLAKKILTSILGKNIGKTLNEAIRKEVDKTDSAIEKIKEDLRKQKESKKKRKKEKNDNEMETGKKKKLSSEAESEPLEKLDKKSSRVMRESEDDHHPKKKSKKDKHKSPSRKRKKHQSEDQSRPSSRKKKSKTDRDKRAKKKKSKKKHREDLPSDSEPEDRTDPAENLEVKSQEKKLNQEKKGQDEFELVIGITDDDVAYLEQEAVSCPEKEADAGVAATEAATSRSGTTSNAVTDEEGGDSDDEVNLRALLLSQMAAGPRGRSNSRAKITWSPKRQQSEEKDSGTSYTLPQYAYAFSRTFITHEEKQLYFPNLFNVTLVDLDYSESESECEENCEEVWDQRRTTNWVTSRMTDPRFSQAMENLLRQSRVSSPDDCH